MTKVLFSPVGGTDPISGQHDGALLHIARVYRPDIIYLFLSGEICAFSDKDNRYLYCLEQLKELTGQSFEVEMIKRPDLFEVHIFDPFLVEFEAIIADIRKKYTDLDLYVNMSSGTPAMKSTLHVIAAMSEKRITPIQVSTPAKKINKREDINGPYRADLQWEQNLDNQENFINRCRVSENFNMARKIKAEIIKKHIAVYDYVAAEQVARSMTDYIDSRVIKLIEAGGSRLKLDLNTCSRLCQEVGYDVFPIKSFDERDVFEYLLLLKIRIAKEEYADFLRAITPLFFTLLVRIIDKVLLFDMQPYWEQETVANKTVKLRWNDKASTCQTIQKAFNNKIPDGAIISWQLIKIIKQLSTDKRIRSLIDEIRKVEGAVRNPVSHSITYVTDDVIKQYTNGLSAAKIFDLLEELTAVSGIQVSEEALQSYDRLNDEIKKYLDHEM